jgi:hypothetical protein
MRGQAIAREMDEPELVLLRLDRCLENCCASAVKTVHTFVERLQKKLGAANVNQLIRIAVLWQPEH